MVTSESCGENPCHLWRAGRSENPKAGRLGSDWYWGSWQKAFQRSKYMYFSNGLTSE